MCHEQECGLSETLSSRAGACLGSNGVRGFEDEQSKEDPLPVISRRQHHATLLQPVARQQIANLRIREEPANDNAGWSVVSLLGLSELCEPAARLSV